jgi:2-oxoglutarate dehydrogenase E2 component (dihydrolipoamide succinyltransferase)
MRIEVVVPNLPESVSDATVARWHHAAGTSVGKNAALVDLETDKVVLEVPAPESGTVIELRRNQGDIVLPGDVLAVIETEAQEQTYPTQMSSDQDFSLKAAATEIAATSVKPPLPASTATPQQPVSPAVRRLLNEHQLSVADIPVTGRISKQDVLNVLEQRGQGTSIDQPPGRTSQAQAHSSAQSKPGDRRVPMSRIRSRIAERMIEAQQTTATLTTFNEVNLDKIFQLRNEHRSRFEQAHGVKLGLMSFFIKASVEALKRFPILNASIDGDDIVYHDYHDIGIAVTTERGLVVPVLRDVDRLGFADIEKAIVDFSVRGRDGHLRYEELTGGTFTITNGGIFGSMLSTPILNPPQSAILGMHAIKERPVVEDGEIVIRPIIYLALSYDHRIIDGREAVSFLFTIKELLEDPSRLLLNV